MCSTGGAYIDIGNSGGGGCSPTPTFQQISSVVTGSTRVSTYKIHIYRSPPGGSVRTLLTFSQPVDTTIVSITGGSNIVVNKTTSDTTLILEADLATASAANFFDMTVTTPAADQDPCLIYNSCEYCDDDASCKAVKDNFEANATLLQVRIR